MRTIDQRRVIQVINNNKMLQSAFKYYIEYNTGCNNPYHNVNHTMAMMDLLIDMSRVTALDIINSGKYQNIMLLAAIFHDMNHSGGKMSDNYNVENAVNAYKSFTDIYPMYSYQEVIDIIRATEFPYKDGETLTMMQQMVRECDNLVCFYDDFLTQVLLGLREEMHTTDLNTLINNELKFFDYSWSQLKLPFSVSLVNKFKDEIKSYLDDFRKIVNAE